MCGSYSASWRLAATSWKGGWRQLIVERLAASIRQVRVGGAREQLVGVASMVHLDREMVRELLRYVRWLECDAAEGALVICVR
jgi:hypothetical protein